MQELQEVERIEEEAGLKHSNPKINDPENMSGSFMSESVYGKLNSPQARKRRAMSTPLIILQADDRTDSYPSIAETSWPRNKHTGALVMVLL
jgi:hypothetical protein